MPINRNVPTCVASGTNNGCRPNPSDGNNSQYSCVGTSTYHGLQISALQRSTQWGDLSHLVHALEVHEQPGRILFSSPIDPFDLSKDSRAGPTAIGVIVCRLAPGRRRLLPPWGHATHGLQVSGVLQTYSALRLNMLSGVTTVQGTAGRPVIDGAFITRNAGIGSDFLALNLRGSRTIRIAGRFQLETFAEAFNLTNRVNAVTNASAIVWKAHLDMRTVTWKTGLVRRAIAGRLRPSP